MERNLRFDADYASELEARNADTSLRKYLKPCEKCGRFKLLDFDICPICGHQQAVDNPNTSVERV